ncbi:hypothetical protein AB1Y20_022787 [Prymnesium parvum]|uniref:Uncharacterized protein n=1 Tax=Prymnesium parvum TaxID=97485 RepID=A0AB34JD53_PRYPA|mmetsp:Transcript_853/g.1376  ORF Transcript_853/g.1376 Transcript_853/m.1376 type:complete len:169 (+) Transcript_853:3-509(+)
MAEELTTAVASLTAELNRLLREQQDAVASKQQSVSAAEVGLREREQLLARREEELASQGRALAELKQKCEQDALENERRSEELRQTALALDERKRRLDAFEAQVVKREAQAVVASGQHESSSRKPTPYSKPELEAAALPSQSVPLPPIAIDPKMLARATAAALIKLGA